MNAAKLHNEAIIIDGLIIAKWNRALFEDMRKGGLTGFGHEIVADSFLRRS